LVRSDRSGLYEQKGTKWFPFPSVGLSQAADYIAREKNPTAPPAVPGPGQDIAFEGNTLVLTAPSADGKIVTRRTYRRLDQPRAAGAKPHPIEGAWKGTAVSVTGGTAPGNPNRQPNIFNAGRYEAKGMTLYQYDLIAKNQSAEIMARNKTGSLGTVQPNSELEFSNNNNTMVQVNRSPDGKSVARRTYTRLE
jgi:hypothetical protein